MKSIESAKKKKKNENGQLNLTDEEIRTQNYFQLSKN